MQATMLKRVLDIFFPKYCVACRGRLLSGERLLCLSCMIQLPRFVVHDIHDNDLARRFWGVFPIEAAVAGYRYIPGEAMTRILHKMKYYRGDDLCQYVGMALAAEPAVAQLLSQAEVLVPVPLNETRLKQRRYNQSHKLCEGIQQATGMEIVADALKRIRFTDSQTAMTREERMQNIRGAFAIGDVAPLVGRHVVLVDDVVTTGATMMECLSVLRDVPGIKISVLSMCMTSE